MTPVFKALKGYSLYKHDAKLVAIVECLQLSSFRPIFTSNDASIITKLDYICEGPRNILKAMKGPCKFPSKWTSKFCAQFIIEVVSLIEVDQRLRSCDSTRKSTRKGNKHTLPPPAAALVSMVETARLKVQGDIMCSGSSGINKKRKSKSTKTVDDYLIKCSHTIHNPEFVEVTSDKIESNIMCPLCNHRSLVCVTTKEQADSENSRLESSFDQKMTEWNSKGRVGSKPRMGKTHSQILGCVCYTQNCIGNNDGSGCFKCKSENGNGGEMVVDKK